MCHILRIIYCMYIYDTTLPTCALHNCILLVDLKINYSLNTRDFQGAFIPYGIHNSILTTTGRFPVCVLICVPDCTPVKVTAHQQPLSCPQPAHKKPPPIPAHVGRNILYVIIIRAIVLMTSCLNQGCHGQHWQCCTTSPPPPPPPL